MYHGRDLLKRVFFIRKAIHFSTKNLLIRNEKLYIFFSGIFTSVGYIFIYLYILIVLATDRWEPID